MAGALDKSLRAAAKQLIADFGAALDTTITYSVNAKGSYNIAAGKQLISTTSYADIKVPIQFINSSESDGKETRQALLYITPDLIGDHQPTLNDEITLSYAGANKVAQITDIETKRGGQVYLYTIRVRF